MQPWRERGESLSNRAALAFCCVNGKTEERKWQKNYRRRKEWASDASDVASLWDREGERGGGGGGAGMRTECDKRRVSAVTKQGHGVGNVFTRREQERRGD